MDINSYYIQGGISASLIAALGIVYKAINHKKCKSKCCGFNIENSIDISDTSPQVNAPKETFTSNPLNSSNPLNEQRNEQRNSIV